MDIVFLEPMELIAMQDYPPLHSPEAFAAYRQKLSAGENVESVIVIPSQMVIEHLQKNKFRYDEYRAELKRFLLAHPAARYFMLGGKHRSAAATLLGLKIPCLVVRSAADVDKIHVLKVAGKLTGGTGVEETLEETLNMLDEHYFEKQAFWSMDEKTMAMIDNGDI